VLKEEGTAQNQLLDRYGSHARRQVKSNVRYGNNMRIITSAILLAVLFANWSASGIEAKTLSLGMSQAEISENLKGTGMYQFSCLMETNVINCVSYSFGDRLIRYFFLFKNERLISILDPSLLYIDAFEEKPNPNPKYPGTKIEIRKPWKDEDFMIGVLKAETMSPETLSVQIKTRLEKKKNRKTSYNVLPAFVILAPLIIPDMMARNKKDEAWLNKFDPFKIKIGAKREDVEAVFGKPLFVAQHAGANRVTHAYGPAELLWRDKTRVRLGSINKRFWEAVVYENDVAIRVFSNDLFNDENIVQFQNEVKQ